MKSSYLASMKTATGSIFVSLAIATAALASTQAFAGWGDATNPETNVFSEDFITKVKAFRVDHAFTLVDDNGLSTVFDLNSSHLPSVSLGTIDWSAAAVKLTARNGSVSTLYTGGKDWWGQIGTNKVVDSATTKQSLGMRMSLVKSSSTNRVSDWTTNCQVEVNEPLCEYDPVSNRNICTVGPVPHMVDGVQQGKITTTTYNFDHRLELLSTDLRSVWATLELNSLGARWTKIEHIGECVPRGR